MDIDPDISNWVLEFLLRQPLEDRTLNPLLRALPLSNTNHNLNRLLLLKKLECQPISETTLDLLEQLEEIDFQKGNEPPSDAMKRAYCAVAVDCTVKLLGVDDDGGIGKFKFFEAVKRVWRMRIGRMEKVMEKGGLGSEELCVWKDEIETAVWEDSVCERVVKKGGEVNAVEAVGVYVREERDKMGPSFLEFVAERMKDNEVLQGMLAVDSDKEETLHSAGWVTDVSNGRKEMQKGKIHLRNKLVGTKRSRVLASGNSRGAKLVECDDNTVGPSNRKYNLTCSTEYNRVREAPESSSLDLRAVVKDPLPDALQLAETISVVARESKGQDPVEENCDEGNQFIVDSAGVVQATGCDTSDVPKPSLMERNSSAHAFEWDESIDRSQDDSGHGRGRRLLLLPSPKVITVSPLNIYEIGNIKKRRRARKWSTLEEDTLRAGVEKYGKGCWKVILTENREIFEDRTEVDLKDKWRNMIGR